jgi:hypothetical protein
MITPYPRLLEAEITAWFKRRLTCLCDGGRDQESSNEHAVRSRQITAIGPAIGIESS